LLKSKYVWNEEQFSRNETNNINIDDQLTNLFLSRKLGTADAALTGDADALWHDPYLFKDMKKLINRIKKAIDESEQILIYGDYDADGTTSTALLVKTLRDLNADVNFYIPHRFFEGYGPNEDAFMNAIGEGYKLIITVDCGIAAINEAMLLKEHDVDLIIVDHHKKKEKFPDAFAIIHPEYDETYPFNELAGAGVTLKVVEALKNNKLDPDDYMLAMFGTVGDVVNLVDENRTIVKKGLEALKETTNASVLAILKSIDESQYKADEVTVGYKICPRLNAPGRMDEASIVVEMLLAEDELTAQEYVFEVNAMNDERKAITDEITAAALLMVKEKSLSRKQKAIVLYNEYWHEGVLGIVASKLVDKFKIAVVVMTANDEGMLKGSARSPLGLDILEALIKNEGMLEAYGGHANAAGLTLQGEDYEALEVGLNTAFEISVASKELNIDLVTTVDAIDLEFFTKLQMLAPFGQGNKYPLVKFKGVKLKDIKRIGAKNDHIKLTMLQNNSKMDSIFFSGARNFIYLNSDSNYDIICELEINEWNGNQKIQANIKDIKCDDTQIIDLRNQKIDLEFGSDISDGFIITPDYLSIEDLKNAYLEKLASNIVLKPLKSINMPSREQFVFVYQTVAKHAPFSVTDEIVNYFLKHNISKGMLAFIVKVFKDVGVFSYEDSVISLIKVKKKVDYKQSQTYIKRSQKVAVLEFLELATANEILEFLLK